jgi:hypothetical protein
MAKKPEDMLGHGYTRSWDEQVVSVEVSAEKDTSY